MENEKIDFEYANELVMYFGFLIQNGVNHNGIKMPFTMLDYLSVTDINPHVLYSIIQKARIERTREESKYKTLFLKYVELEGGLVNVINDVDEVLEQKNTFTIGGVKYVPTREDVEEIFDVLDKNNIPKYNRLIYNALHRKALNCPILPLIGTKDEKKLSLILFNNNFSTK